MLNKKLQLIALLLLVIGLGGLHAQSVYVNETNGGTTGYALKRVQSMHFDGGNLYVTKTNGNMHEYALSELRHLTFTEETLAMEEALTASKKLIALYPNPVSNTLHIDLTNVEDGSISIFNMQGQLLQTQKVSNQSALTLEVAHLPKGVYFCRYNHLEETQTIKFIKE